MGSKEEEDGHKEIPTGTAAARACIDHASPIIASGLEVNSRISMLRKDLPINRERTQMLSLWRCKRC